MRKIVCGSIQTMVKERSYILPETVATFPVSTDDFGLIIPNGLGYVTPLGSNFVSMADAETTVGADCTEDTPCVAPVPAMGAN